MNQTTIELKDRNCIYVMHPAMDNLVIIFWDYSIKSIRIKPITNKDLVIPENKKVNLEKYQFIILNPDYDENQKWKLSISVEKLLKKVKIEILKGLKYSKDEIKIIDEQ